MKASTAMIIIAITIVACQFGQVVIEPAAFALFMIAIIRPIQVKLERKVLKSAALVITIILTSGIIIALFSLIAWSGHDVAEWTRKNSSKIQDVFRSWTIWLEAHDIFVLALVSEQVNASSLLNIIQAVISRVNTTLGFTLLVLIYVIMGLAEAEYFEKKLTSLPYKETAQRVIFAAKRISHKFQKYILVRTIASVATGIAVWLLALTIGLELASAWGLLAYALNYLPLIGPLVATALPTLCAVVQFGDTNSIMTIFIGLIAIQFIIGNYLEPVMSGSTLSIAPSVVIIVTVFWTFMWGALGAFLGVPIAIAALTMCEQFPSTRWISAILAAEPT